MGKSQRSVGRLGRHVEHTLHVASVACWALLSMYIAGARACYVFFKKHLINTIILQAQLCGSLRDRSAAILGAKSSWLRFGIS